MVGIDDHEYSDEALQWLFNEFVDDGDEIVCVRVVEKDVRVYEADKRLEDFQREANAEVEKIKARCGESKAISIVLEYAVGKLHSTFQRLVCCQGWPLARRVACHAANRSNRSSYIHRRC